MSNRERKRSERRKRKRRSAQRDETSAPATTDAEEAEPQDAGREAVGGDDIAALAAARGVSRSEVRNQLAREALEPLEEGERPFVVTVGALISALVALLIAGAWITGAEVSGERPGALQFLAPATLFGVMALGMWKARYWAVLGFQAVMAIFMVGSALTLISATSLLGAITPLLVGAVAGTMFWFTVKALARIQMPDRHLPR
jgi:hypothetical protein